MRGVLKAIWDVIATVAFGLGYLVVMVLGFLLAVSIPGAFLKLLEWGMRAFPDLRWLFYGGQVLVALAVICWWASVTSDSTDGETESGTEGAPSGRWGASKAKWYVVNWGRKW